MKTNSLICLLLMLFVYNCKAQTITNYSFAASSGTFTALSGATSPALSAGTVDEGNFNALPIGFDFFYMGTLYTSVSASTNGWLTLGANITNATAGNILASAGAPRPVIAPLWDDLDLQSATNFSYLTSGTAGSRVFTLQWLNEQWINVASGNTISFQVKLYESTGKIEFIYRPEAGALSTPSASIGITATATGSGKFLSLNGAGTSPTVSSTTETTTINAKPASGQKYAFTPPVPIAPSNLTFTNVTPSSMTVNWTDNSSDETGFVIYGSADGVNYQLAGQTAAGVTTISQSGLTANTTYYAKIYAVTEGGLSTVLSGSQTTHSIKTFTGAGNFSTAARWTGGTLPAAGDDLIIDGTCTVDNNVVTDNVAYGTLVIGSTATRTLNWTTSGTNRLNVSNVSSSFASSVLSMTNGGTLIIRGTWTSTNLTFNSGAGTIEMQSNITLPAAYTTYNNLTINGSGITVSLPAATVVTGNLTITAGTFNANNFNLTSGGNWTNNVSTTAFTAGTATVTMNGTIAESIAGSFATTFNNLAIASSNTVTSSVNFSVSSNLLVSSGTLDLGSFTANRASAGGTLTVSNGATLKIGGTNTFPSNYTTHSIGATSTIEYSGTTQSVIVLTAQDYGHLIISGSGTKTLAGTILVTGNLTISAGTFDLGANTINRSIAGGTLTISAGAALKIGGTNTFPSNYTTHSIGSTSTIEYSGTTQSVIVLTSQDYGHLIISGSGTKTLAGTILVTGNLTISAGTFDLGANTINRSIAGGTLTISAGAALKIGGTNTFPSNYTTHSIDATSTVNYSGTTQSVGVLNSSQYYGNLIISGSGTKTLVGTENVAGDLTISAGTFDLGSFTINRTTPGGTLSIAGSATLKIGGTNTIPSNFSTHSVTGISTIEYSGTNQSVAVLNSAQDYQGLTISGSGTKTLAGNVNVFGTLSLTNGTVMTGANILYVKASGIVNRVSGYVIGNLKRGIPTGSASRVFDIGDATNYTPVTLVFASITTAGDLTVSTTSGDHANISTSTIDPSKSVNRTWTLINSGLVFATYGATFTFVAGDLDAGATTSNFIVGKYSAGWTYPTVGTKTSTTTQATGVTAFGDFQLGELCPTPTTSAAGADQTGAATCGLTTVTLAANVPAIGTGAWSIVSGAGGTVTTPTSATSTFSGIAGTSYTLRWTISSCTTSTDDVVITFNKNPTASNAGADQTSAATCGLTTVTLAANVPAIGTGAWSIVSGAGGTVTTPASASSTFSGTAGTTYTLRWTISNSPCTASTDDVVITFNRNPTTSNAGVDQTGAATCGLTTVTLAANVPAIGTGAWSIVSGAGGTVTTPTSATSTFSGTAGTTYTLRWTISNSPCTASTDDVVITFNQNPTASNAGADQTSSATCGLTTVTLAGNVPAIGTGAWSIVSGAGGTVTTPTSATSTFSGTAGTTYTLRWTISNSPCTASTDDVVITFNQNPTASNAGADQTSSATCGLTTVTLAGNVPAIGTGAWSIVSGAGGTVTTPTSATSTFSGTAGTTYTLRWTISNSPCTASTDDVVITFNRNPTTSNAGVDQTGAATCGLITVTLAGNVPAIGTGAWSIVSGAGGTITTPTSATSTFSGTAGTTYTLRWTISNSPCTASTDDVVITFNQNPTASNAGVDQTGATTCGLTTVTLAANAPAIGTGAWSIVSGAGGTVTTPTSATSTFSGTAGTTYTLRWTISNSPCAASTDDVIITFNQNPSSTISYAGTPYCSNGGTATPTITGTAGTFTSTPGLSINAVTGAINLAASTAGTYTVTNSVTSSGGCTSTSTASISITALPSATISYPGTPFCKSLGSGQAVTQTGTAGGSYSSAAGLIIDASTGAITPGTSTAGTYTVVYTIAAATGCSAQLFTTSVTITAIPSATISYSGTPFCTSLGTGQAVTQTGTAGGTYSSTAGLTINASTGAITPGTSTAGVYTVTYTMAAAAGCSSQTATTSVTITVLPSATISYGGSPFCKSLGTGQAVTQTGTAGGTYSSTAGLTINASTGAVTPGTSTAGLYTVTYTMAAAAGCSAQTATTSVTITTAPGATISYAGSPYCSNSGTALVTFAGTAGGTYSSTAGLTINSGTGTITLGTSTAGTYTVTYTVAASGGCALFSTSASVTISAALSATISYTGSPYCSSAGTATVTSTGAAGGTYSSSSTLLTINSTTGDITLVSSIAGTYTVTYTMINGACTTTATTSVTVTTANISQIPTSNLIANYTFAGNANDVSGNNSGTLQNSPVTTADRFNNANKAFGFNGNNQYVSTTNAYTNPTNFTESIWFKTSTTTGGKLIGFGKSQTGTSSQYDRHIYMNNAGKIYFGVYPGSVITVNSALSYNDNNWHLATATLSGTAGMALYMDGILVDLNTNTVSAENYTGYWRIGGDNINSWTSQPTSYYFNGTLDDVLIYDRALNSTEIATLYTSPDGAGNNGPVCVGSALNLTATTLSGATYAWTGPNGFASSAQNPTLTFALANMGVYSLQVTAAGCIGTAYTNVISTTNSGQWTGNISTDWATAGNWCTGVVPTSSTDVIINSTATRMPSIISTGACNNLTINTGATLTTSVAGTLNIAGTLTNNGTMTNGGTTNFNGTSGQQTFSGVTVFNNLTVNNTSGLFLPATTTVNNNLLITAGTLDANNFNITVKGNWTNNASTTAFTAGTATVTFNSTTAQAIGGTFATTFNNLTIANTGNIVTLLANTSLSGNLSISSGTFDLAGFTANRASAGGMLTVSNDATLKIGGTNTYPTNYTGNTLVVASTVEYSGTNQTVSNQLYGNLKLSGSGGAAVKTFPATALTIVGNLSSILGAATSLSFTAASNITVNGNVSIGASTTFNGGSYSHSIGGSWANSGTFTGNTGTIIFTGAGAVVSGSGTQNFNNLTVAASAVSFTANSITLTGSLATTGSGSFSQASGGTLVMSGTGTTISGTGISVDNLTVSGTVSTSAYLNLTGNLSVSGSITASAGTIALSGTSKTMSGAGAISFAALYITGSITTAANFSISSGLTVSGSLLASAGTATFTGTSTLSGTADLFNVTINGTSLKLSASSILGIGNVLTITAGTLDITSSVPNTIDFNGTRAQNINAITYCYLNLSNGNTKTAAGNITSNYDINIGTGTTLNPSTYTFSVYGNWINNGTFIPGTSTVQFLGPSTAYISGGTTTFNILTSNTSNVSTEIILQSSVTAAIVNMTEGLMRTGSNTLTITNTRTGNGIILGNIQRIHAFTTGVAYAFEGPDNTISFSSVSAVTSITVAVTDEHVNDFPFGGSINRDYNITVPAGAYNATLRLHYEDDELNGNNESSVALWHYNGSTWVPVGKTANSATSNYVEQSGLTNIGNRWTISDNVNLVQWNGSVSTDWNTAANWTVLQGSASRPPSSSDIVDLGTATFTNQPTIGNSVTVKNINFGSAQAVTLTLASGGSLTVSGNIDGDWVANATHTINVNAQNLTVNGSMILSDGIIGQAIDLNIGSGTVTILADLVETGGANINFSGTGTLNIGDDFTYSSGTFTAGSGTVIYTGIGNQDVAHINYNDLTINKTAGLATVDSVVNIAGDLLLAAGELDNFSTTSITGNVTISSGATLLNSNILHIGGNWANSGSYIGTGVNVVFDGAGTQTISATTFNNLEFNKPVGSLAVLTGDVILKGNLVGTSGTLDIKSFFFNRDIVGGSASMSDSATLIIAADNAPNKFASYFMAPNSTVIFNGIGTQHLLLPGLEYGNITFRDTGHKILYTPTTVKGNLTIESGADFDAGSNTITLNGNWINNGTFTASASTILCNGTSKSLSGNTTFKNVTVAGSYTILNDDTFNGLLNINNTGSISSGGTTSTTINGDLINSGVVNALGTTTISCNVLQHISLINAASTVLLRLIINGSVSPVINSTAAPQYGYITINNTAGITSSVGVTVLFSLVIGPGASFNGGNSTHNILGDVTNNGIITSSGTLNFIPSIARTVNLGSGFSSTGTVVFGGAGAMTLIDSPAYFHNAVITNTNVAGITPLSDWDISNNFTVNSGSILNAGNHNYLIGGNLVNNGTINSETSTFSFNGTDQQDIQTRSAFNNLTINKTAESATLFSNTTVNGVLNFVSGNIETGTNLLIQPSSGTVTGAAQNTGWVNGKLQKNIAIGTTNKTFETGDENNYAPVSIAFVNVTNAGDIIASTTAGDHAAISTSAIDASKSVNRYWTLTNNGVGFTTYSPTFSFAPDDVDAGADPANFVIQKYNGISWSSTTTGSRTDTSTEATGVTSFSDFQIGELSCKAPSISSAVLGTQTVCQNTGSADLKVSASGDGLSYQWYSNTINSNTGGTSLDPEGTAAVYTPSTATEGSLYYYAVVTGTCGTDMSATAKVIVDPLPAGYDVSGGGAYCANSGGVTINLSNSETGKSYQLILDGSTDGSTAKPGTGHAIDFNNITAAGEYTIVATNVTTGCTQAMNGSVTISINPLPVVSFSGLDNSYCLTAPDATLTGIPSDGIFSGVGIADGSFSPLVAGIGGPYNVTYTYTDDNGCTNTASRDVIVFDTRTAAPGAIYGPTNSCPFAGADTTMTYHIQSIPGAVSYQWSVPDSMILMSGQGDTVIHVKCLAGYYSGYISVKTASTCGYAVDSTMLFVETLVVDASGSISGPHDVCNYIGTGDTVTYFISNVLNVKSLSWTVPAGVTIISGQTDSVLKVTYSNTFINGRINVTGSNECSSFWRGTLLITRTAPDKPIRINGPAAVCEFIERDTLIRYSVEAAPRTTSYNWILPAGVTLISGQGDTAIYVKFLSSFITGSSIGVSSVAACGSSPAAILYLNRKNPVIPVSITGPTDVCSLVNTNSTATYSIIPTMYSTSYNWSVPVGATIISGQGDTGILVQFDNLFISGNISVTAMNNCGNSEARIFALTRKLPATAGTITGPIDACPLMNTLVTATYSISPITNSTSYIWNVPIGASIISGQGDTSIQVNYSSSFISGNVTVSGVNNCGSGIIRSLAINRKLPAQPGSITGITDACPITGTTTNATYTIRKVMYANSYLWVVPTGATIISGQGDTGIVVNYSNSFISGNVTVRAVNNCVLSTIRSLAISRKLPAVPTVITGITNICPIIGTAINATYTIKRVVNATSYIWNVPTGANVVSGQGDTSIRVNYSNSFISGAVTVSAVANCSSSAPRSITVTAKIPLAPAAITGPVNVCLYIANHNVATYTAGTVTGAIHYSWTITANMTIVSAATDSSSIGIIFTNGFVTGSVSVRSSTGCGSSTAKTLALVTAPAKPVSIIASGLACKSTTVSYTATAVTGATGYTWTIPANATLVSGAGSDKIMVSYSSTFTSGVITARANNNCGSSLATALTVSSSGCQVGRNVESFVKAGEAEVTTVAGIYPNPNNGNFTIKIQTPNGSDNATIQVIDLFGAIVLELKAVNNKGIIVVNVSDSRLSSGLYTVRYVIGKEVKYIKMVVQK